MKVLLLRGDNLRHQALGSFLQNAGHLSAEVIESKMPHAAHSTSPLMVNHFMARDQSERDFFQFIVNHLNSSPQLIIQSGQLNSSPVFKFIDEIDFDLAITFGVSILHTTLIQKLRNKVLGVHLGLSPYYRGSGTNFFPFVNSQLAAVGYTLMHLGPGIDNGEVIHQGRASIVLGDSIHTIGNRNITKMMIDIVKLLDMEFNFSNSRNHDLSDGRLYKRSDFTQKALEDGLNNLNSGLIARYLSNSKNELKSFPIIENQSLKKLT